MAKPDLTVALKGASETKPASELVLVHGRVPKDLRKRARKMAAEFEGLNMQDLVSMGLEHAVSEKEYEYEQNNEEESA